MATDYNDIILQSIDTVVQKRLSEKSYDETSLYTIVDDSQRQNGIYQITDGFVIWTAVANFDNLSVNDRVYAITPKGDQTANKLIVSKYYQDGAISSNLMWVLEKINKLHQLNGTPLSNDLVIKGNGSVNKTGILYQLSSAQIQELDLNNVDKLGIEYKFKTNFTEKVTTGTYGVTVEVIDRSTRSFTLSSNDMFGDIYNIEGYSAQQQVIDISDFKNIQSISFYVFQNNDFDGIDGTGAKDIGFGISKIISGFESEDIEDARLTIYCDTQNGSVKNGYNFNFKLFYKNEAGAIVEITKENFYRNAAGDPVNPSLFWYVYHAGAEDDGIGGPDYVRLDFDRSDVPKQLTVIENVAVLLDWTNLMVEHVKQSGSFEILNQDKKAYDFITSFSNVDNLFNITFKPDFANYQIKAVFVYGSAEKDALRNMYSTENTYASGYNPSWSNDKKNEYLGEYGKKVLELKEEYFQKDRNKKVISSNEISLFNFLSTDQFATIDEQFEDVEEQIEQAKEEANKYVESMKRELSRNIYDVERTAKDYANYIKSNSDEYADAIKGDLEAWVSTRFADSENYANQLLREFKNGEYASYQVLVSKLIEEAMNQARESAYQEAGAKLEEAYQKIEDIKSQLEQKIAESSGMYTIYDPDPNGGAKIYIANKPTLAASTYWLQIDSSGISSNKRTSSGVEQGFVASMDGTIFTQMLAAQEINAEQISAGTLDAARLHGTIIDGRYATIENIDAGAIKTGVIDASRIAVENLNADNITTGNISADKIKGGKILIGLEDDPTFLADYDTGIIEMKSSSVSYGDTTVDKQLEVQKELTADLSVRAGSIEGFVESNQNIGNDLIDLSDRFDKYKDDIDYNYDTLTKRVDLCMTDENVTIAINTALSNGVKSVQVSEDFKFDNDGLTISNSESNFTTNVNEDGMLISENGNTVLQADNTGVNAKNLHATTYLIIGETSRFEDWQGRTACFWK